MATTKDVHRPTLNSDEVFALIDLMDQARSGTVSGLNPTLREYYIKLDKLAYAIGKGHAKPAYVVTGIRKESMVNLDSLGASSVEKNKAKEWESMADEDIDAELERLNTIMLNELVADGIGDIKNVPVIPAATILREERDATDNDSVYQAMKSASNNS